MAVVVSLSAVAHFSRVNEARKKRTFEAYCTGLLFETMTEALRLLLRNDSHHSSTLINLDSERDDASIAQALKQNQYVSCVELRPAQRNANWDHLFRVLATRGNLLHFVLLDGLLLTRAPAERIRPILQAIQQNSSVCTVEFANTILGAEDLCSFLDNAAQITDWTLRHCALREGEQGAREVAAALRRNTNIVTLKLYWIDWFLGPILLEGLVSNVCLKHLVISAGSLTEATSNALQGVVESSTASIQHLELIHTKLREAPFRSIAQGLMNGRSIVTELTLGACTFQDEGSIRLLSNILERTQNLSSFAIKDCMRILTPRRQQFHKALCSALSHPDSPLRHFQFEGRRFRDHFPNQSFSILCEAVAVSKLESFSIGRLDTEQHFTALTDAIPSMKIRKLAIQLRHNRDGPHIMQMLRQAVKNNFTLQSVKYQCGSGQFAAPFFDASAEDETLKSYLERNARLAQWVENPATVPKHLWKKATTLAAKAGPPMLFRLLRKIGPEVLPIGSRKRKRSG